MLVIIIRILYFYIDVGTIEQLSSESKLLASLKTIIITT